MRTRSARTASAHASSATTALWFLIPPRRPSGEWLATSENRNLRVLCCGLSSCSWHQRWRPRQGQTQVIERVSNCACFFRCNVVINCFENAYRVAVTDDVCEDCSSQLLDVNFNKVRLRWPSKVLARFYCRFSWTCQAGHCFYDPDGTSWFEHHSIFMVFVPQNKTPLEGGATEHVGCMFCDPIFKALVEMKHASARRNPRGRSGGRGRGGRGRGRGGRGRGKPKDKMAQLAAYFV